MSVCAKALEEFKQEFEIAVTSAEPFLSIAEQLSRINDFCEKDIKKRIYPQLTMKDAKSIICFLFPYKNNPEAVLDNYGGGSRGKIVSGDVWLKEDYHVYVKNKLRVICDKLKEEHGGEYMPFCDTGPLADKEIAVRSGLCEYGRNSLALNKKHGSFFYIGYIITNQEFEGIVVKNTDSLSQLCNGCYKCISSCPTNALSPDSNFDYKRCVSYISQKKGVLTDREARCLNDTIYGCHICQNVCPANNKSKFEKYVDLSELDISNKEFKQKYNNTAAGFIGKKNFIRNAIAVLNNHKNKAGD